MAGSLSILTRKMFDAWMPTQSLAADTTAGQLWINVWDKKLSHYNK